MAAKKKQSASSAGDSKQAQSKFAKHAQDDAALAPESDSAGASDKKGLTLLGRIGIFLIFPTLVGVLGLYMGYLAKRDDPNRDLSFDTDFALPFVLALSMCLVIGFQTRGFTSGKPRPLISWPKVKKRTKIVHKHVVAGQNPDKVEVEDYSEDAKKDEDTKKKD